MAQYIYPAVFTPEDGGMFSINFPDIDGCFTCGNDLADGIKMANDALSLMLTDFEDEGRTPPIPSEINDIEMKDGEFATLISCDTTLYRHIIDNATVKRTLTIPAWLNRTATDAGINFSQVLQDALKAQLNIA